MSTATIEQVDPKAFEFSEEQSACLERLGWFSDQAPASRADLVLENGAGHNGKAPRPRRWSLVEFSQMAEWGWFDEVNGRVMLIDGEILLMPKQKFGHYKAIDKSTQALAAPFGTGYWIRSQASLEMEDVSDAEPDVSVVRGSRDDYTDHPRTAILVVEASESTLRFDRGRKGSLYARGGIADYWVLNLIDRQIEVYRNPVPDPSAAFGFKYADKVIYRSGESVEPLARPGVCVKVDDLLP